MTQVNILYFDEAAPSSHAILDALHLITATSGGTLKAQPCAPDTIYDHICADLTGIGFDYVYHKHDPHTGTVFHQVQCPAPHPHHLKENNYG